MYDLLKQKADVWDLFTRKKEYQPSKLDEHGRFFFTEEDLKNASSPEVSRYLVENGLKVEFPENKTFAVCLTHDMDDIEALCSRVMVIGKGQILLDGTINEKFSSFGYSRYNNNFCFLFFI